MFIIVVVLIICILYDYEIIMFMYKNIYLMKMLIKDGKNVYY